MKRILLTVCVLALSLTVMSAHASQKGSMTEPMKKTMDEGFKQTVVETVKDKLVASGTLDIYDDTLERVRNLRLEAIEDKYVDAEGMAFVTGNFRDTASGDTARVLIEMSNLTGGWQVDRFELQEIAELKVETKEYTDADIIATMKSYVEDRSKATGGYMLYDEERSKMRILTLKSVSENLRKYGILNIATATFADNDNKAEVEVDITVKNDGGLLTVDTFKIKEVRSVE